MVFAFINSLMHPKKKDRQNFHMYKNGFKYAEGIIGGIALNDIWMLLNLPGRGQPVILPDGKDAGFDYAYLYQFAIGVSLVGMEFLGILDTAIVGAGVITGMTWADKSAHAKYIGGVLGVPMSSVNPCEKCPHK